MVQTFLIEESKELIYDQEKLEEWKQKCEELGLGGQLELASTDKSPIPFEAMNTVSQRVYETLCPDKVKYKEYKRTTIPLEVLGFIHLSVNEGYFKEIEIWSDDKTPDPLAVGYNQAGEWGAKDYFIIARWGDVLRPFEELKDLAIKRYINSQRISLQNKISDYTNKLNTVDINSMRYFDAQAQHYDVVGF